MQRRDINAADAPAPAGQYTRVVEVTGATRMLYLSGQVGVAADGSIPEDAETQCAFALRNLQAQLRAAGTGIENLVKITTIVDRAQSRRYHRGARRPRGGSGCTSAGKYAHDRRPKQSGQEGGGGRHSCSGAQS